MKNDAENELNFSDAALSNRDMFFSSLNTINIFVEDVSKEHEYEEIFERLLDHEISICSIFPLGGKDAVLREAAIKGTHDSNGTPNVFIVDGDFDILWEDRKSELPNLIYLDRYNIESYYCSQSTVIGFLRGYLKRTRKDVEDKVKYSEWQQNHLHQLYALFRLFAVINRHCPQHPNVGLGVGKFLGTDGTVNESELHNYENDIAVKIGTLQTVYKEIDKKISVFLKKENSPISSIICGKYQIESICRWIKSCCNKNIKRDEFRSYLVTNFDIEPLFYIKEKITQIIADLLLEGNSAS